MAREPSIKISIDIIATMLEEISKYNIDDTIGKAKKLKINSLDEKFWSFIRKKISSLLISNYNNVRIRNKPEYYEWKRRARERGLEVQVTKSGDKAPVQYIRPALRTGTLRNRLREVQLRNKRPIRKANGKSIEYTVSVGDLYKDYGSRMRDLILNETGQDILLLTQAQQDEILEFVLDAYLRS